MAKKKEPEDRQEMKNGGNPDPGQDLIDEACEAYGIAKQHVLSSAYHPETGETVILTAGGTKVRYRKGDRVQKLDPVRVDGIVRKKMRVITGEKKR